MRERNPRAAGLLFAGSLMLGAFQVSDVAAQSIPGGLVVAAPLAPTGAYVPTELAIVEGTQLQFLNLDLQQHDVVSEGRKADNKHVFKSSLISFGQYAAVEGTETLAPGDYGFYCSLHRNMVGTLSVVGPPAATAAASGAAFETPAAWGPVGFGDSVAYRLTGACDGVAVRAVVRSEQESVEGVATGGCEGVVTLPDEASIAAAGIAPHDVTEIALVATVGDDVVAEVPLRAKRLEAEHGRPVLGAVEVSSVDDPFGGGSALDVRGPGATISLGTIDLSEVSSISLRAAGPDASVCHPSYEGIYCRAGSAIVTSGDPAGPIITVIDIRGTDAQRPWIRTVSEPIRYHPAQPVEVFVTFVPAVPTPAEVFARVNYLELNGSGVAEPHAFPADPPGAITLFDGSSLEGWRMAGTGWFELEDDGSMRSVAGYGLLWHDAQVFDDFILRLEFKANNPDANSGVFVRFPDPQGSALAPSDTGYEVQIQDYGQAYVGSSDTSQTGAIYSFEAADRINTRTIGEWNTLEIRAEGHDYTVTLNGRSVTMFTGARLLEGHIGVQNHDPYGTVWFRDIRVIPI